MKNRSAECWSDARSQALATNFAAQWLYLRNLRGMSRDFATFPNFDDNLRQGFERETELFFESIVREDRSVLDLLRADYTYVNERLAKHYGIPDVYGSEFRRVTLPGDERRGLLGQGSVLAVTSYATRTSPVLRGKWLLENILGTPVPPPPPGVPALAENHSGLRPRSVRERMEEHRKNPACAGCHNIMDPLGFSLENFDAVGAWRVRSESGAPIDASGKLVDGTIGRRPRELAKRATGTVRSVRANAHGEAVDLRHRPRCRVLRYAGLTIHRARVRAQRLSFFIIDSRHRAQRPLSDAADRDSRNAGRPATSSQKVRK